MTSHKKVIVIEMQFDSATSPLGFPSRGVGNYIVSVTITTVSKTTLELSMSNRYFFTPFSTHSTINTESSCK